MRGSQLRRLRRLDGACRDDPDWHHKNRGPDYDCAWVAGKPDSRCSVIGVTDETEGIASEWCKETCGACGGDQNELEDEPELRVHDCDKCKDGKPWVATDEKIRTAVSKWFEDRDAAEAKYGKIGDWDTSGVTDMSELFCANDSWQCSCYNYGNKAAKSFGRQGP